MLPGLEAQMGALRERLAAGERRVGWKVALNDRRVQRALDIAAPVIGYLTSATLVADGGSHSLRGATRPAIEPEVAVHVGEAGEVAGLGAALEVIDVDMPFEDVAAIMARNVFHRAAVLGAPASGTTELADRTARMTRNGRAEPAISVAEATLVPRDVVDLVGGYLEAVGESLRAGDVIIAGSLTTALPLAGDERVVLEIDGLGSAALDVRSA